MNKNPIVTLQQSQQRQLVRDGKSLVQLQHESDREQVEEVQKKLEADRRAKAQDKWEAEEEAALKHEEALERVDVSRELREYKKKQMEEAIEEQRAETQRVVPRWRCSPTSTSAISPPRAPCHRRQWRRASSRALRAVCSRAAASTAVSCYGNPTTRSTSG